MGFRPCIDLRKGRVVQIVGSTYRDADESAVRTNFETDSPAAGFAEMYRRDELRGGHVIMLGPGSEDAALDVLRAYPGGLQLGGGVRPENARSYLDAGASHVIVTSYVFSGGTVSWGNLERMADAAGPSRLVLDLSCVRRGERYLVVTDRWQNVSDVAVDRALLARLAPLCAEFLVHAASVEGMQGGVDTALVALLAEASPQPVTYAGGVRTLEDLGLVHERGKGLVDVTVGSALDIFGGALSYRDVVAWHRSLSA